MIRAELAAGDVSLLQNPPNGFWDQLVLHINEYRVFILRANAARA
jgi:hypothetical protein